MSVLNRFDVSSAIPHLVQLLKSKPVASYRLQYLLQERLMEKHLPRLTPLLSDDDPRVYNAAFEIIEAAKRRLNLPKNYVIQNHGHQGESTK